MLINPLCICYAYADIQHISVYQNASENTDVWAAGYKEGIQVIVSKRKILDVENVPELILHKVKGGNIDG